MLNSNAAGFCRKYAASKVVAEDEVGKVRTDGVRTDANDGILIAACGNLAAPNRGAADLRGATGSLGKDDVTGME